MTLEHTDIPENPTNLDANVALQILRNYAKNNIDNADLVAGIAAIYTTKDHPGEVDIHICTVTEPPGRTPQIDAYGVPWIYIEDTTDDGPGTGWQRQRIEAIGEAKYLIGPPMSNDWEDVIWYGPLRPANETDSVAPIIEYFTKAGATPVRYTMDEFHAQLDSIRADARTPRT